MVIRKNFDYEDIRRQVMEFLSKLEIQPYDESDIVLDGELHRYRTHDDKRGQKSGAILIHTDGWAAGYVQDWRRGLKENWKYDISSLDDDQRAYYQSEEYKKKCEAEHRQKEAERKRIRMEFTERARRMWDNLPEAPEQHPYLKRKRLVWLNKTGLRYNPKTKSLAVPLKNIEGLLMSIQ